MLLEQWLVVLPGLQADLLAGTYRTSGRYCVPPSERQSTSAPAARLPRRVRADVSRAGGPECPNACGKEKQARSAVVGAAALVLTNTRPWVDRVRAAEALYSAAFAVCRP